MSVLLFDVLAVNDFDPTPVDEMDRNQLSDPVIALLDVLARQQNTAAGKFQ